jgi:hypothetical protein
MDAQAFNLEIKRSLTKLKVELVLRILGCLSILALSGYLTITTGKLPLIPLLLSLLWIPGSLMILSAYRTHQLDTLKYWRDELIKIDDTHIIAKEDIAKYLLALVRKI